MLKECKSGLSKVVNNAKHEALKEPEKVVEPTIEERRAVGEVFILLVGAAGIFTGIGLCKGYEKLFFKKFSNKVFHKAVNMVDSKSTLSVFSRSGSLPYGIDLFYGSKPTRLRMGEIAFDTKEDLIELCDELAKSAREL